MALYEKSVKFLFRDMIKDLDIQKGEIIEREKINSWFRIKYPLKNLPLFQLILLSYQLMPQAEYIIALM